MKTVVIGGGPAGLMAAEVLSAAGVAVHVYDAMPSVGRKFLLAGKGGLNLTHSEPAEAFASRYGTRQLEMTALLRDFGAAQLRDWARTLGVETFVGSSGRVFPVDMKAAPLLRAWLQRLRRGVPGEGVQFRMRHRWVGWGDDGHGLLFVTPQGTVEVQADAVVLALGGASWGRLGSTGAWVPLLCARGVRVAQLQPTNCGFEVVTGHQHEASDVQMRASTTTQAPAMAAAGWSSYFSDRFAGKPFKSVAIHFTTSQGERFRRKGEFVATAVGVEGSLIYAASSLLRDEITTRGFATFHLDLLPDMTIERVLAEVAHPRGSRSLSNHLKSRLHLDGIKAAVLHELLTKAQMNDPTRLAHAIKGLPVRLLATRPIDEAISSAGGVPFEALNEHLMLMQLPGVFCAGEMLDWEAPTGGYLLTGCFSSGKRAGDGVLNFLRNRQQPA